MIKLVSAVIGVLLLMMGQSALAQNTTEFTSEELAARTVHRRAVDAVIWGVPAVTLDMMRQAYFRDAKASYNDIVWWPKGAGWQNQSLDERPIAPSAPLGSAAVWRASSTQPSAFDDPDADACDL
jgi:hypothetical protein